LTNPLISELVRRNKWRDRAQRFLKVETAAIKPVRGVLKSFYKDLPPEVTIFEEAAAAAEL
jgi:hypothetical protein